MQRTLLFAATGILALSLVALPITVDPHSGSLVTAAAMAKNSGNGGGHGNSGGNGGGAGSNGNSGGAGIKRMVLELEGHEKEAAALR